MSQEIQCHISFLSGMLSAKFILLHRGFLLADHPDTPDTYEGSSQPALHNYKSQNCIMDCFEVNLLKSSQALAS